MGTNPKYIDNVKYISQRYSDGYRNRNIHLLKIRTKMGTRVGHLILVHEYNT